MNPISVDDALDELLALYDEAASGGGMANRSIVASSELQERLDGACDVIDLLESVFPRQRRTHPEQIGRFQIRGELGSGGFARVYLAHDPTRNGDVALKVPHWHVRGSADLCRRFLREAQAAAALNHPNIVALYEVGEAGPFWYLSSAYCAGPTLENWLAHIGELPTPDEVAGFIAIVADAVQHMHSRGVVHRDLKPSNILLEPLNHNDSQLSQMIPRISDFGLAKVYEEVSNQTASRVVMGTPQYMAPEQAVGESLVGPSADIYGLGTILYELLTRQVPFTGSTSVAVLHRVIYDPVPLPSRLRSEIAPDLEAICLKCLEKRPEKRYASAAELATDLRRFLEGRPTEARPLSLTTRAARAARRNPAASLLIAVSLLSVIGFVIGLTSYTGILQQHNAELAAAAKREAAQANAAAQLRDIAEEQSYASSMMLAADLWQLQDWVRLHSLLARQQPQKGQHDRREFIWRYLAAQGQQLEPLQGHHGAVDAVKFTSERLLSIGRQEWIDWPGQRHTLPLQHYHEAKWSADGSHLILTDSQKDGRFHIIIIESASHSMRRFVLQPQWPPRYHTAFSPTGSHFAYIRSGMNDTFRDAVIIDSKSGRESPFTNPDLPLIDACTFTPNGREFIWSGPSKTGETGLHFLDLEGQQLREISLSGIRESTTRLNVHPNGRLIALSYLYGSIEIWDSDQQKRLHRWDSPSEGWDSDRTAKFSPDGKYFVATFHQRAGEQHVPAGVRIWNVASGQLIAEWNSDLKIHSLDIASDGTIGLGCDDRLIRLWRPFLNTKPQRVEAHTPTEAWAIAHAPDGSWFATAGDDHRVRLWDATGKNLATLDGHDSLVSCLAVSPDGRWLASGSYDDAVMIWNVADCSRVHVLHGASHDIRRVTFTADGSRIVASGRDRLIHIWDVASGKEITALSGHTNQVRALLLRGNDELLSGDEDGRVIRWSLTEQKAIEEWPSTTAVWSLAETVDGKITLVGLKDGTLVFRDSETGRILVEERAHTKGIETIAISADGKTLATGGKDRVVQLWHIPTQQAVLKLPGVTHEVNGLSFSPDSNRLLAALHDGAIVIWKATNEYHQIPGNWSHSE